MFAMLAETSVGQNRTLFPARHRSFRKRARLFVVAAGLLGLFRAQQPCFVATLKEQNHEKPSPNPSMADFAIRP